MNAADLQEPGLRWTCTAVFAGCAVAFCTTLGEVAASSSFGLLFGVLFAGVPSALLWGRALHEATIRQERESLAGQSTGRLQVRAEDDEPPSPQSSPWGRPPGRLRAADEDED